MPSLGILTTRKHRKQYLFPSSGEGWKTLILLGPLEWANLNHWPLSKGPNRVGVFLPSPEDGNIQNAVFWDVTLCGYFKN
jgi:hypothetical protein